MTAENVKQKSVIRPRFKQYKQTLLKIPLDLFKWEGGKLKGEEDNCGLIEDLHFKLLNYIYESISRLKVIF